MTAGNAVSEPSDPYPPVGVQIPGDLKTNPPIPEDHPTVGYQLNHFMLRIRDPKPTMHFYIDLMGMRTIFTTNTGPITVYYLGYPQTSAHRADPAAFSRDTLPHPVMSRTLGLLELCHYHGSEHQPDSYISTGNNPPSLGFNHLGFTVPDVTATVERLKAAGVKVVKDVGQGPNDSIPITSWEKSSKGIATAELDVGFSAILKQIAFVEDPNGYLVELVPQNFVF
ncbi:Lactoylglutathione lyase [Pleurostoma richardsiae]|uniref:Lactoylglutathione lyase n=1 Tax=Pleurostoma richardsiae TaxID=41990 RepID=A0AA38VKZ4_9PEZI|nr:Lactoylglutathione lyase [Pleurostoma richardsiae]